MDDRRIERLRWRCRRGLLELDLVLLGFLERQYPGLSAAEQLAFDELLETPDELLIDYVQGDRIPPENKLKQIVEKLRK
ncbi:MAG: succinate dehydrogenase assembly factor 2 [Bacteroidota bacterium]